MMYEDKKLVCKDCGSEFVFTAGEQGFYAEKGFVNDPKRCRDCRDARKSRLRAERPTYTTTCADCGGEAKVPFQPAADQQIYCSECFSKRRESEVEE